MYTGPKSEVFARHVLATTKQEPEASKRHGITCNHEKSIIATITLLRQTAQRQSEKRQNPEIETCFDYDVQYRPAQNISNVHLTESIEGVAAPRDETQSHSIDPPEGETAPPVQLSEIPDNVLQYITDQRVRTYNLRNREA
ncbi:hypothetical protein CLF_100657 [Clonorchis sinensis]|uniref:Uncharacterized protein n=1 Tax=Clonorchis sinensis TaxID=79923 RepID=G7Y3Y4_CLOSI|nr:hypothetical protein CLF_100657 [Clonorchis sinensis]